MESLLAEYKKALAELEAAKKNVENLSAKKKEASDDYDSAKTQSSKSSQDVNQSILETMGSMMSEDEDFSKVGDVRKLQKNYIANIEEKALPRVEIILPQNEEFVSNECMEVEYRATGPDWDDADIISIFAVDPKRPSALVYSELEAFYESFEYTDPPEEKFLTAKLTLPSYSGSFVVAYTRKSMEGNKRVIIAQSEPFSVFSPILVNHPDSRQPRAIRRRGALHITSEKLVLGVLHEYFLNINVANVIFKSAAINQDVVCLHRPMVWAYPADDKFHIVVECDAILLAQDDQSLHVKAKKLVYGASTLPTTIQHSGCNMSISYDWSQSSVFVTSEGDIHCRIPFTKTEPKVSRDNMIIDDALSNDGDRYVKCKFCETPLFELTSVASAKVLPSGAFDKIMHEMICCPVPTHAMTMSEVSVSASSCLLSPIGITFMASDLSSDLRSTLIRTPKESLTLMDVFSTEGCDALITFDEAVPDENRAKLISCKRCDSMVGEAISSESRESRKQKILERFKAGIAQDVDDDNNGPEENSTKVASSLGVEIAQERCSTGPTDLSEVKLSLHEVVLPKICGDMINKSELSIRSWPWKTLTIDIEQALARAMNHFSTIYNINTFVIYSPVLEESLFLMLTNKEYLLSGIFSAEYAPQRPDPYFNYVVRDYNFQVVTLQNVVEVKVDELIRTASKQTGDKQTGNEQGNIPVQDVACRSAMRVSYMRCTSLNEAKSKCCITNGTYIPLQSHEYRDIVRILQCRAEMFREKGMKGTVVSVLFS